MPSSSQSPPPAPRRRASASPSRDAGVKGITRKVIRTLEGLGHPALSEADDEADDEHEVARALEADAERRAGKQRAVHPSAGGPQKKRYKDFSSTDARAVASTIDLAHCPVAVGTERFVLLNMRKAGAHLALAPPQEARLVKRRVRHRAIDARVRVDDAASPLPSLPTSCELRVGLDSDEASSSCPANLKGDVSSHGSRELCAPLFFLALPRPNFHRLVLSRQSNAVIHLISCSRAAHSTFGAPVAKTAERIVLCHSEVGCQQTPTFSRYTIYCYRAGDPRLQIEVKHRKGGSRRERAKGTCELRTIFQNINWALRTQLGDSAQISIQVMEALRLLQAAEPRSSREHEERRGGTRGIIQASGINFLEWPRVKMITEITLVLRNIGSSGSILAMVSLSRRSRARQPAGSKGGDLHAVISIRTRKQQGSRTPRSTVGETNWERSGMQIDNAASSGVLWKEVKRLADPQPPPISVTAESLRGVFEKRLNPPAVAYYLGPLTWLPHLVGHLGARRPGINNLDWA
ncbi:hypothetical protein FB451DRAFT_1183346 [Mycena latifolia]|nr:hypothetical protein FB451DRAFT_1183346 [Mycena latifolia]